VYLVILFGEEADLREREQRGKDGMIAKEHIIEIDLASLIITHEISIGIVDGVESKAGEIHRHEIEVHPLDTNYISTYLLRLKF
jgi:hypothetical protein